MDAEEIMAIIREGTSHRGWISNSFAQVEFLLGDLIKRCQAFPEYADQTKSVSHSAPTRVSKVRKMLEIKGPLDQFSSELTAVLDAFSENQNLRNLLAHGFCTFHHTPAGDAGFHFQKFARGDVEAGEEPDKLIEHTFRLIDLEYNREQLVDQAARALQVFRKIHAELGWGEI